MPSGRLLPNGLLLLLFLGLVLPAYSFVTGDFQWLWYGVALGSILFVVKWRWWWEPLREHVHIDTGQE